MDASTKRGGSGSASGFFQDRYSAKRPRASSPPPPLDPEEGLVSIRHEFGEHGGVNMSIEASSTFTVMEAETMGKMFKGELGPDRDFYIYSRHFNPTVLNLGRQIAAMEGTQAAYCTASGMSAVASVILQLCDAGDHVVASNRLYGGTYALLRHFLPRTCGIATTFVDVTDTAAVERAVASRGTKILYVESIANPVLTVADIPALAAIAHARSAALVVDNTFAPMVLSPARLGADVVVHSISKFISGQSDVIAGAVCGPAALIRDMMGLQHGALMLLGPTMNPTVAFHVSGRLAHLGLRMREHSSRAMEFAKRMKSMGLKVIYPGLEDHPQHELLKALGNEGYGYGGVVAVDLDTDERANRFMHYLQNFTGFGLMAVSLGYHETLMSCSSSSTSSELNEAERAEAGVGAGLVRLSVGYTGTLEQRWKQLHDAIVALGIARKA
ncbi:hypothetical protein SELMODRAFT_82714 [Selaginella moellendorffii]|uniref:Methionine gamma-lyase n=1 Tax=Selaginella moellendorffii TaxID=88036 RepID=D8R208_SELML|nr:methionine gamma-lyase [Selaginella moellendorffii]EFJ33643.1 hypothetical protein SELMODRAFT_82714 [Selaginella moellendorffii]|eukprot:XP_002964805.1 methionine gamma-lyase [Selaginella moellendorffii]